MQLSDLSNRELVCYLRDCECFHSSRRFHSSRSYSHRF